MLQLVAARAVQGLGAGGIIPLSMTIIGELYTLAERPRTQALFSGVWGVASVAGPLVGGYITDALSWRWVFYINIPFGILCTAVIAAAYPASKVLRSVRVDWLGAALLFLGVSALLVALGGDAPMAPWLTLAVAVLGAFVFVESRARADPANRGPAVSGHARTLGVVFLVGFSLFGAIAFVPLFVQTVMGGTATEAGQVLTPLFLGWVIMSVISAKATVKVGYRVVSMTGGALIVLGFGGLTLLTSEATRTLLFGACFVMGGWPDAVAARRAARRAALAAGDRDIAQPVLTQHRRRRGRGRDGRHSGARRGRPAAAGAETTPARCCWRRPSACSSSPPCTACSSPADWCRWRAWSAPCSCRAWTSAAASRAFGRRAARGGDGQLEARDEPVAVVGVLVGRRGSLVVSRWSLVGDRCRTQPMRA